MFSLKTYFQHINDGISTTWAGLKLTFKHLWAARTRRGQNNIQEEDYFNQQNGMVTLQYPLETMPVPDNGRYRLHNEMDDCIVCDKCAKVCPVDCIEIEPIKATGEVGKASDGSPIRLYAAKFDIDMAKCCYCGLCTTVCPTECLTMTKTFDYSEFDVRDMNYHYANLNPTEAEEKKALYEQFVKEKEELKRLSAVGREQPAADREQSAVDGSAGEVIKPKPAFRPTAKPLMKSEQSAVGSEPSVGLELADGTELDSPKPIAESRKPVFRPTAKPVIDSSQSAEPSVGVELTDGAELDSLKPIAEGRKPVFRPTAKPVIDSSQSAVISEPPAEPSVGVEPTDGAELDSPKPIAESRKPIFKPTMKPKKEE